MAKRLLKANVLVCIPRLTHELANTMELTLAEIGECTIERGWNVEFKEDNGEHLVILTPRTVKKESTVPEAGEAWMEKL